jgi:hypothetical protein
MMGSLHWRVGTGAKKGKPSSAIWYVADNWGDTLLHGALLGSMPATKSMKSAGAWPNARLVQVAVIGAYLDFLFYKVPRDWVGYKFILLLLDYKHGPARRSLEGELLRHIINPPYSVSLFHGFIDLQIIAAILLFTVIVWKVATRSASAAHLVLALIIVSSPTTIKNLLFDQGRQDIVGFIALEIAVLLGFLNSGVPLSIFLAVAALPLALINENLLLLYLPACLAVHCCRVIGPGPGKPLPVGLRAAPVAMYALACLVCFTLPRPTISKEAYHAYLQTKSVQALAPGEPERLLYFSARDNFAFARGEWPKFRGRQFARTPEYAFFGAVLAGSCAAVALSLRGAGRGSRLLYFVGVASILPGFAVLFLGASDVARWFANMNLAVLTFSLWYMSWSESNPPMRLWFPLGAVAAVQAAMIAGFGVIYPVFDFGQGAGWFAS